MEIVTGPSVKELQDAVRGFLREEDSRAQSLNQRGSALTGFVGVILSVGVAAGAVGAQEPSASLHRPIAIAVGALVALALLLLVGAIVIVVVEVLLPSPGLRIATNEIQQFPTARFVTEDAVMVRGYLMRGYVEALTQDRDRNETKARWLKIAYLTVCSALVLVALAGAAATIDRYVA